MEDTTSANRQSELEKGFSVFFDDDRIDACEKMQSIYQNKEDIFVYIYYPRLACIIFEVRGQNKNDWENMRGQKGRLLFQALNNNNFPK